MTRGLSLMSVYGKALERVITVAKWTEMFVSHHDPHHC